MPTRFSALVLACLLAITFQPAELQAAPQIMALLETGSPTPLVCENGQCSGEFSGFCLQKERPDPKPGTQYRAEGGELTLVVTDASGVKRRLPADDYLEIVTKRSYTAVRIGLPESVMRDLGAVSVALEIGERVALVPVAQPGDKDPQTEADIALALGPQRSLGERVLQQSPAESGAVALTNRMLNALPKGRTSDDIRNGLWNRAVAPYGGAYPLDSVARAQGFYRRCMAKVENGDFYTLRDCLEIGHDALMLDINRKYWEAGPDS
jgi:hypothetical protein